MASNLCRRVRRGKRRELCLMFLTCIVTVNTFTILFPRFVFKDTEKQPFSPDHFHPRNIPLELIQQSEDGEEDNRPPHPFPHPGEAGGEGSLRRQADVVLRQRNVNRQHYSNVSQHYNNIIFQHDSDMSQDRGNIPQQKSKVFNKHTSLHSREMSQRRSQDNNISQRYSNMSQHSSMTKLIPPNDQKSSPAHGQAAAEPLAQQSLSNDTVKGLALFSDPSLHKATNRTVLEEAIRSLEVFSDNETMLGKTYKSFFKPQPHLVTSFVPGVMIDSVRCSPHGPFLLALIHSVAADVDTRQAIRSTWASPAYGATWPGDTRNFTSLFKVVFFIGAKRSVALKEEAGKFHDIVQMDFRESYQNLTLKTALGVEWVATYCPGASYVIKVDQDTFVYLPLLWDLLRHLTNRESSGFVLGFHKNDVKLKVLRHGKWKVVKTVYPFRNFPRYLLGPSYVLSSRAVRQISALWRHMPVIPNEDVYITGILAKAARIVRIHCDLFYTHEKVRSLREMVSGRLIAGTGFKPYGRLYDVWEMVTCKW